MKLYRVKNSKYSMLGGVCAGIAHQGKVALWFVRFLFILAIVLQPLSIIVYLLMWVFLPVKNMTDKEFNIENISFREIPIVKPDSFKFKEVDGVVSEIEDNIIKEIKNKKLDVEIQK